MASYDRLKHDPQGRVFVPINVDLQYENDSFLTLPKGIVIFSSIFAYIFIIFWGVNVGLTFLGWVFVLAVLTFVVQFLVRKVVFQENYFFKQWLLSLELGKPKASRFWNIASIRKTALGDILVFSDLKIGVILELEKDTIIGKASDNEERHYDAWAEFYHTLFESDLYLAQMNLMQPAGRDERFNEISDIAQGASNKNVRELLELNTAQMKSVSSDTLDEHDYLLIYTKDMNRMNTILNDALECGMCLMEGAYVGARILSEANIYQLPRENFNVTFFDGVEAQMNVYRTGGYSIKNPFHITSLEFEGKKKVTITPELERRLEQASRLLDNEQISYADWNILDALNGKWDLQYTHTTGDKITLDGEEQTEETKQKSVIDLPNEPSVKKPHTKFRERTLVKDRKKQSESIDINKLQQELDEEETRETKESKIIPADKEEKNTSNKRLLRKKATESQKDNKSTVKDTHNEEVDSKEVLNDDEVLF